MKRNVYTPVIKGKLNDIKAIAKVEKSLLLHSKPLIEAMPVAKGERVLDHIEKIGHYLSKYLSHQESFVDFYGFAPGLKDEDNVDAVVAGMRSFAKRNLPFTPTYGFQRDDQIWNNLADIVATQKRGFCFRVDIDDLDDQAEDTWAAILERSAQIGLSAGMVDILVDLRDIGSANLISTSQLLAHFLSLKPPTNEYRSLIVVGSSALKSVADIQIDSNASVARNELLVWALAQKVVDADTSIIFGDYGVIHPDFSDQVNNPNINAKLRYTSRGRIHYYRGHGLRMPKSDYAQYFALAEKVRSSSAYEGPESSFGDWYVDAVADHATTSGSPATWIVADLNHHVSHTIRQMVALSPSIKTISNPAGLAEIN